MTPDSALMQQRADAALRNGRITPAEHAYFVSKIDSPPQENTIIVTQKEFRTGNATSTEVEQENIIAHDLGILSSAPTEPVKDLALMSAEQQARNALDDLNSEQPPLPPEQFKVHHAIAPESVAAQSYTASDASRGKLLAIMLAVSVIPILMIIGALFLPSGGLTGNVVLDIPQGPVAASSIAVPDLVSGVSLSGTMYGEGNATIMYETVGGTYLIGTITSDSGAPRTNKPSYASGEAITIEHAPATASYYFDDGTTTTPVEVPFNATTDGTVLIVANMSGNLTTYRLPVIVGFAERETTFTNLCGEACVISPSNGTIIVAGSGTTVFISNVATIAAGTNRAPFLAIAFPQLDVSAPTSINLSQYFIDPDGDTLSFAVGASYKTKATVTGDTLTLEPLNSGTETIELYASDLQELVPASITITVPDTVAVSTNDTNATITTPINSTPPVNNTEIPPSPSINETNTTTTNVTTNVTTNISNATLDCSNPNPNLRPLECLQENDNTYFNEGDKYWENLDRQPVAKFNALGNMLITGSLVEQSNGVPAPNNFMLGTTDANGALIPAVWIDSLGNLHIKGRLHEEELNLNPPPGTYSLTTRRSIYLMYVDTATGDVYLRGNLIPNRRSLG